MTRGTKRAGNLHNKHATDPPHYTRCTPDYGRDKRCGSHGDELGWASCSRGGGAGSNGGRQGTGICQRHPSLTGERVSGRQKGKTPAFDSARREKVKTANDRLMTLCPPGQHRLGTRAPRRDKERDRGRCHQCRLDGALTRVNMLADCLPSSHPSYGA
ncbi:hypothetical protein BaRGS_00031495 [Batillaria attramentaria]|uniref:Uncharacterized protein n=1 Tax=Batillaria attramentaria TaxID=370345 RepID=A0ABD0JQW2_9CAEN